jgi:hypothetical protein
MRLPKRAKRMKWMEKIFQEIQDFDIICTNGRGTIDNKKMQKI